MATKWKMIGIRIPDTSDLDERLRKVGFELRMTHSELLNRWLVMEEKGIKKSGQLNLKLEEEPLEKLDMEEKFADFKEQIEERFESMSNQMGIMAARLKFLEPPAPTADDFGFQVEQVKQSSSNSPVNEKWEATKAYILELRECGENQKQIAARLNEEKFSTKSGEGKWYPASVGRAIEEAEKDRELKELAEIPDEQSDEELEADPTVTFKPHQGRTKKAVAKAGSSFSYDGEDEARTMVDKPKGLLEKGLEMFKKYV